MAVQMPSIGQLIRSAGVQVKDAVCSCCLQRPLYEICATPTLARPARRDLFYVCASCDVPFDERPRARPV